MQTVLQTKHLKETDLADLFESSISKENEPLAARMRPRNLDEYIGQDPIVGKGRLLRRAIQADQLTSVIFYGPPGTGKTTLARVIANSTNSNFITLNAVLTGVADIRQAISQAEDQRKLYQRKTILFVDEVHRWNKSQQDALLPWVENGTIILIGATTENPFFEVNKALVSRSRVFQLKQLTSKDLMQVANQALTDVERGYGHWKVEFEEGALEHLVETANGDARSLLNALQLAVETTPPVWQPYYAQPQPEWGSTIYITKEAAEESIQKKVVLYDKDGDYHYDIISAFIKSLRGRDPDAACYWLARMVKAGEDPHFIFRRMLISACEDTGLADPMAISVVESCAQAFDRVGLPEGRYFLTHAALYLSTAPKSNSSMAFFDALSSVEKEDADVPNHLRDASRDAEGFGHGKGYLYPHAYRDHWVAQQYLPDQLVGKIFYNPSRQGYEDKIREEVLSRRELQIAAILNKEEGSSIPDDFEMMKASGHFAGFEKMEENLTFTQKDARKEEALDLAEKHYRSRLDSNKAEILMHIRDNLLSIADLKRHHRSLIWNADDGLLLFEVTRRTPEGLTMGACRYSKGIELLNQYAVNLEDIDKPLLSPVQGEEIFSIENFRNTLLSFGNVLLDRIFFKDAFAKKEDMIQLSRSLKSAFTRIEKTSKDIAFSENEELNKNKEAIFAEGASGVFSQRIPKKGSRLKNLIEEQIFNFKIPDDFWKENLTKMEAAENDFYEDSSNSLFTWDEEDFKKTFSNEGFTVLARTEILTEKRRITNQDLEKWFSEESAYGKKMIAALGQENLNKIKAFLCEECPKRLFQWKSLYLFAQITLPHEQ